MKIKSKTTIPSNQIHTRYCLVDIVSFNFIGLVLSTQGLPTNSKSYPCSPFLGRFSSFNPLFNGVSVTSGQFGKCFVLTKSFPKIFPKQRRNRILCKEYCCRFILLCIQFNSKLFLPITNQKDYFKNIFWDKLQFNKHLWSPFFMLRFLSRFSERCLD